MVREVERGSVHIDVRAAGAGVLLVGAISPHTWAMLIKNLRVIGLVS
jgi:hypothetical protein